LKQIAIRPGKVDSLFPVLNFDVAGWSLFIIDYAEVIQLIELFVNVPLGKTLETIKIIIYPPI